MFMRINIFWHILIFPFILNIKYILLFSFTFNIFVFITQLFFNIFVPYIDHN